MSPPRKPAPASAAGGDRHELAADRDPAGRRPGPAVLLPPPIAPHSPSRYDWVRLQQRELLPGRPNRVIRPGASELAGASELTGARTHSGSCRPRRLAGGSGEPALRPVVTSMPVAGFSGTLAPGQSVFGSNFGPAALGMVRAKTGNLTTVVSLTGIVSDADGRQLAFAFMADQLPAGQLTHAAGVMDAMATALAGCGCR